jgi:hypothetical protein
VNHVQLRVEPVRVYRAAPVGVATLEQQPPGGVGVDDLGRRRDADRVLQERADVGPQAQQGLVGGVLGPLDVLEALCGLGAEARDEGLRLADDVGRQGLRAVRVRGDFLGGGRFRRVALGGVGGGVGLGQGEGAGAVDQLGDALGRLRACRGGRLLGFVDVLLSLYELEP